MQYAPTFSLLCQQIVILWEQIIVLCAQNGILLAKTKVFFFFLNQHFVGQDIKNQNGKKKSFKLLICGHELVLSASKIAFLSKLVFYAP